MRCGYFLTDPAKDVDYTDQMVEALLVRDNKEAEAEPENEESNKLLDDYFSGFKVDFSIGIRVAQIKTFHVHSLLKVYKYQIMSITLVTLPGSVVLNFLAKSAY